MRALIQRWRVLPVEIRVAVLVAVFWFITWTSLNAQMLALSAQLRSLESELCDPPPGVRVSARDPSCVIRSDIDRIRSELDDVQRALEARR